MWVGNWIRRNSLADSIPIFDVQMSIMKGIFVYLPPGLVGNSGEGAAGKRKRGGASSSSRKERDGSFYLNLEDAT
jgi:hypothetical protein